MWSCGSLVRKLIVHIDDELEKEMSAFPEVDWIEVAIKAIRDCIRDREKCKFYHTVIDRVMSQERKGRTKSPNKKSQKLRVLRSK
jgi:hypothetical protein